MLPSFLNRHLACLTFCLMLSLPASAQQKQAPKSDSPQIFKYVEQMPEFPGNVGEWLSANVTYPMIARDSSWEGRVIVEFQILGNGLVTRPVVKKSSGYAILDREAVRAISAMPNWKPGKQGGKPVIVYFTLPVVFRLE